MQNWSAQIRYVGVLMLWLSVIPLSWGRDYLTFDGQFTLCQWQKVTDCQLLDGERERELRLTRAEQKNLDELRRYIGATHFLGQDLIDSFGKPYDTSRGVDGSVEMMWLYPGDKKYPGTTIAMGFLDGKLVIVSYTVPPKFRIGWHMAIDNSQAATK